MHERFCLDSSGRDGSLRASFLKHTTSWASNTTKSSNAAVVKPISNKKARIKAGITIGKPSKGTKTDGAKKAVKKAPAKKAAKPAAKKAEAAPETEAPAEGTTENA